MTMTSAEIGHRAARRIAEAELRTARRLEAPDPAARVAAQGGEDRSEPW
jgi:hypothetical protein